ncbi:cupin domain-containing protein [Streptomyces flavofungini]|uniref:cupin domain-containing protein n=1 Tax=Streptomyces flavofungini TaxID=68200 RepID=UPI0025AFBD95|nr:cupin domain-containing protein [Streptomyces flavofungini]WJV44590.1 cupin domain-containing protein [Streptomyces flavofungini]
MTAISEVATGVRHVRSGEGQSLWVVGDTYTVKASGDSTNGAFALLEASVPPGGGPPPHVHGREDEAFYLLDGELEVLAGGTTARAHVGDFLYLPRGIVHGFTNPGVTPARMLILTAPAGFERFFAEAGAPARPGEQAPPFDPADFARLAELTRAYGAHIEAPADGPPAAQETTS